MALTRALPRKRSRLRAARRCRRSIAPSPVLRLRRAASARDEGVGVVAGELVDVPWLVAGDLGDSGLDGFRLATRVVGVVLDQSVDLPRWEHVAQAVGKRLGRDIDERDVAPGGSTEGSGDLTVADGSGPGDRVGLASVSLLGKRGRSDVG